MWNMSLDLRAYTKPTPLMIKAFDRGLIVEYKNAIYYLRNDVFGVIA